MSDMDEIEELLEKGKVAIVAENGSKLFYKSKRWTITNWEGMSYHTGDFGYAVFQFKRAVKNKPFDTGE